ncbi:type II toxin-antitoxin system VapC family toxin [Sphingomonas sp. H39-1-10]|uniref:type II toxin-antitoxin system VapC family toxin n=1 Tax=Sphingomonas pollutisoli TaxID=3030829 RepID=UPI0023B92EA4|nr:type II toxin-antitoxin system VapC family toxin [Sphingomonas pollutisoli]MDF0488784.1 type II toxin-antitoxin system VapC family toxin [Sphingomonas pollutisoli]
MNAVSFDSNILIDALNGHEVAREEIRRADVPCISRVTWIEVLSKVQGDSMPIVIRFLNGFTIDELDVDIAGRAAQLRRERTRLKLADSVILASAQAAGRVLVTRNTKDFPATMPGIRVPYRIEQ